MYRFAHPLAALVFTASLLAHDPGLSSVRIERRSDLVVVHAAFANADFRELVAIDRDADGRLTAPELAADAGLVARFAEHGFRLCRGDASSGGSLQAVTLAENDDVELTLHFGAEPGDATLVVAALAGLSRGHRCYAALVDTDAAVLKDALLTGTAATLLLPAATIPLPDRGFAQSWRFLALGIEHILIGFDHLAFLLALLAAGAGFARVVATISAFTIAHSITLLAAALGFVRLPGLLVEATIAGSIVVVAAANLWQRGRAAHRWPWAFGFGLIHGFGFAGVLAELQIGGPDMLLPLLTFNLGVEVGQLAFACVAVPLLALATRHPRGRHAATAVSIVVGLAGCWWLGERLLG